MISTITIGGLTIGTLASGYILEKHEGFDFPKVRVDVRDRGQYHGAKLGAYNYGRRLFVIEGMIYGDTATDYETKRRALQAAVDLFDGLQEMVINTQSGLSLRSEVIVNSDLKAPYKKGNYVYGTFRLELVAPYPFIEEDSATATNVAVYSGGGGAIPMAIPFSLGTGGSGLTTITNNGNTKAFPTIKIYGPIISPSIANDTVGESLSINYTLSTNTDYIELDMYNRTAKLNGVTNILQYVSGDWWALAAGANSIKLFGTGTSGSTMAVVTHRDTYLGI